MVVVIMGVAGSGKTVVGEALSRRTGWPFADADEFHTAAHRATMHAGIPLTDDDRAPWLQKLHDQIARWLREKQNGIMACSALKESYRVALTDGTPRNSVRFVYLTGPEAVIEERMEARHGHFMPEALLPSQLATLEPPRDAIEISITQTIPAMVQQILSKLEQEGYAGMSEIEQK